MPNLPTLSLQQRDALERQDAAEMRRLSASYQAMVDRLEGDVDAFSRDADPNMAFYEFQDLPSYKRLIRDAERELEDYRDSLLDELAILALLWLGLGATNSDALLMEAFNEAGVDQELKPLDDGVLAALNVYLAKGSPLYQRLQMYPEANVEYIRKIILDSVTKGLNPRELARLIVREGFGMGLTDALRMARTLQLYAYRDATIANYRQHADVLQGWVWSSALIPGRTCMSCVNMHGSIHTLAETLNDHHNGLCTMLPLVIGAENPVKEAGAAWFARQSEAVQKKMMGATKWEAWTAGVFTFDQLTGAHYDEVYGAMRIERSLKSIMEGTGLS